MRLQNDRRPKPSRTGWRDLGPESWRDVGVMMLQEVMRKGARTWPRKLARSCRIMTQTCSQLAVSGSNDRSTPFEGLEVTIRETRELPSENRSKKTWRDFGAVTEITVPLR